MAARPGQEDFNWTQKISILVFCSLDHEIAFRKPCSSVNLCSSENSNLFLPKGEEPLLFFDSLSMLSHLFLDVMRCVTVTLSWLGLPRETGWMCSDELCMAPRSLPLQRAGPAASLTAQALIREQGRGGKHMMMMKHLSSLHLELRWGLLLFLPF